MNLTLHCGDCLTILSSLEPNSIDSIVTDPPYGLGFMGKAWDIKVPPVNIWSECLRVLKPGGHMLVFAGTRTQHRMAVNIEDAGFEIRDMIAWVYGSGFPKSLNLDGKHRGWGTALKPALEPVTVARKPLVGTVAHNISMFGTGAMNIDNCRVPTVDTLSAGSGGLLSNVRDSKQYPNNNGFEQSDLGRWPANFIHDGSNEVRKAFPNAGGQKGKLTGNEPSAPLGAANCYSVMNRRHKSIPRKEVDKSAARFFYVPKVSKREREEGCELLKITSAGEMTGGRVEGSDGLKSPRAGAGRTSGSKNNHPTVKPVELMAYLIRLVTPIGGVVLDPFMGSGSTGKAAIREGFSFIGAEIDPSYFDIAKHRIAYEAETSQKQGNDAA